MARVGVGMRLPDPKLLFGSSDIGMCPLRSRRSMIICLLQMKRSRPIQPVMPSCSGTGASEICIKGAKGLAMTGLDLLLNESLRQAAAEYHEKVVPDFYKEK